MKLAFLLVACLSAAMVVAEDLADVVFIVEQEDGMTGPRKLLDPVPGNGFADEILAAHNAYRRQVGVPYLYWSNNLASGAQQWANYLASTGEWKHSQSGYGENLWRGTSHHYSFTQMVNRWGAEKQYFKRGIFPDVSTTGRWQDVGHYTQMIWRKTTHVGCGGADGVGGQYTLVCRYNPRGNYRGQPVYATETDVYIL